MSGCIIVKLYNVMLDYIYIMWYHTVLRLCNGMSSCVMWCQVVLSCTVWFHAVSCGVKAVSWGVKLYHVVSSGVTSL